MRNLMIFLGAMLIGWPLGYAAYLFFSTVFSGGGPYYGE